MDKQLNQGLSRLEFFLRGIVIDDHLLILSLSDSFRFHQACECCKVRDVTSHISRKYDANYSLAERLEVVT